MTKSGESTIINHNRQIMSRNLYPKRNSYIKERGTIIMTKIKNAKKGMAKKTLSMSLVVAMLATSNVPVWAAEFSDGSDAAVTAESAASDFTDTETPAVDDAEEVAAAQVTEGYTVDTNEELKAGDWNTALVFGPKSGVESKDAKFAILDQNGVEVKATTVEVYSGDQLIATKDVTNGDIAAALSQVTVGFEAYKSSKQVTAKVYIADEKTAVYEMTAAVNPVSIAGDDWYVNVKSMSTTYNGKVQAPNVEVANGTTGQVADVVAKFTEGTEAKNVGTYHVYAEGIEENGYTGTKTVKTSEYRIDPATPTKDNLSVVISGTTTYNGITKPTVVVTDKLTGEVIPASLYDVTVDKSAVGNYDKNNVTVTLKANAGNVVNNFVAGAVPADCISGSYTVSALDLSKLSEKYTVNVADKKAGQNVTEDDITFTDKTTGTTLAYSKVIPDGVTIVTTNNDAVGTGKVTLKVTDAKDTNIIGEFSTSYNVVNATIGKAEVSVPAGTKIGTTTFATKTSLADAATAITAALAGQTYTGSAIEPLKDIFSNLVLTESATVTEQKLVLGTDYDLTYTDNTDSKAVSGKSATVTLTFKGSYSGKISYTFDIAQAEATVEGQDIEVVPGKNSYDVVAKVVVGTKEVPAADYTVTTKTKATKGIGDKAEGVVVFNNKNYTIKDGDNPKDGYAYKYISSTVVAKDISKCTGTVEGSYVYTGDKIEPKLVIKDGTTTLVEGVDYTIASKTGTSAGAAHVTVKGLGNYTGTLTIDYTIAKANLANATVLNSEGKADYDVEYTGFAQKPAVETVKIGNVELKEYDPVSKTGDYTITYDENAVEVGSYSFTIKAVAGSKNVEGEYTGTFKVTANQLTGDFVNKLTGEVVNDTLDVSKTGAYYTGSAITMDSFKTKYVLKNRKDGKVLTEGKDYELVYTDNVNAGIAKVAAYGLGNYAKVDKNGKKTAIASLTYCIEGEGVITKKWIQKIADVEYAGGLAVEPEVVVVKPGTKDRLVQGKDYTVTTEVTKIGDHTGVEVTIKGNGAYTTSSASNETLTLDRSLTWKVTKKDFANTTVSVDSENNKVTVMNGTVVVPSSEYDVTFSEDGKSVTVTAKADSEHYTGSKTISVEAATVGTPVIVSATVARNNVTPVLSGDVDNAAGYDYVISTDRDCITTKNYTSISKNQVSTSTTFKYVDQGVYYVYCHAWKRDENGKKVFGEWSNAYPVSVTAITPDAPVITSVKVSGSTIKVTYNAAANATGYDVVLGTSSKKENGETRPYNYGAHKKLNIKEGTVTATFKNVPAGTWVVGMHAFNKTAEDGGKVFSPWSNLKKATVK